MLMDADDISCSDRLSKQLAHLISHPEIDALGGGIVEFGQGIEPRVRRVPLDRDSVRHRGKFLQPMNHVTILARKTAILSVGGYQEAGSCEDYYLIARWLTSGIIICNMPDVLVRVRISEKFLRSRRGLKYFYDELAIARYFRAEGYISQFEYCLLVSVKFFARMLPIHFLSLAYRISRLDARSVRTGTEKNQDVS
jgi:hypothetical protein